MAPFTTGALTASSARSVTVNPATSAAITFVRCQLQSLQNKALPNLVSMICPFSRRVQRFCDASSRWPPWPCRPAYRFHPGTWLAGGKTHRSDRKDFAKSGTPGGRCGDSGTVNENVTVHRGTHGDKLEFSATIGSIFYRLLR